MAEAHANARLEAFSDGVFAIALTLLIIDIKVPATESVGSTAELWRALRHLTPAVHAFILSFAIILITWVNHHGSLKLVHRASAAFIYANGLLLLTVVFIPFPTALLGEYLWTDHAAPAVVLYNAVLSVQAISWILVGRTALRDGLTKDERGAETTREGVRRGYQAAALYALLAVGAFWFPRTVATITALTWAFWLVMSIRLKHA